MHIYEEMINMFYDFLNLIYFSLILFDIFLPMWFLLYLYVEYDNDRIKKLNIDISNYKGYTVQEALINIKECEEYEQKRQAGKQ